MLLRQPPLLFAALTLTSLVQAEELQLAPVEVTSSEASAGEVAQTQLKSVPGGTNYIDMNSVQQGRGSQGLAREQ
jgi:iron complex outermembrane receptor protein